MSKYKYVFYFIYPLVKFFKFFNLMVILMKRSRLDFFIIFKKNVKIKNIFYFDKLCYINNDRFVEFNKNFYIIIELKNVFLKPFYYSFKPQIDLKQKILKNFVFFKSEGNKNQFIV